MKTNLALLPKYLLVFCCVAVAAFSSRAQVTANFNNAAADGGLWGSGANWDTAAVPTELDTAIITGFAVNYSTPMTAANITTLTLGSSASTVLNVAATGFNVSGTTTFTDSAAETLNINSGGVMTNNTLAMTSRASLVNVNSGGTISNRTTQIANNGSFDGAVKFTVNSGGVASLGNVSIGRHANSTANGLIMAGGTVYAADFVVGIRNSYSYASINSGSLNVSENLRMGSGTFTSGRPCRFDMTGSSTVTCSGSLILCVTNYQANFFINSAAATFTAAGIQLFTNATYTASPTARFTNSGSVYLGTNGINVINTGTGSYVLQFNDQSTLGATADWTGNANLSMPSGAVNFRAADAGGTAHNITLTNVIGGGAALVKTGTGVLTLCGTNTYTGGTVIANGTFALAAGGALGSGTVNVGSNTTYDISGATNFVLGASRTVAGFGSINGHFTNGTSGTLNPGTNSVAGTLTFSNSLAFTGGATAHYDLASGGPGPNNDFISVAGDLNASGTNTIEISGGGSPGSIHPLITYGGAFNGGTSNFVVSGGSGALLHDSGTKTISFQVATVLRAPTNVVWKAAAPANTDWDAVNRTNWLNGTLQDFFVSGDAVAFNATGNASSNINLLGNLTPASVVVDSALGYNFTGSGAISGTTTLVKTNSGKLGISTTNSYTGGTTIAGGVLEASLLADGGVASSIGASSSAAANLVLNSATLRYVGGNVGTDRGITLTSNGTFDLTNTATTLTLNGILTGGQLIKTGSGILSLNAANTHTGGDIINAGTLTFTTATAPGPVAAGITNNGATLRVVGATVIDHVIEFNGNCGVEFTGVAAGNVVLRGAWFGSGNVLVNFLVQNAGQTFTIGGGGQGGGNMANFSGTVDFGTNSGFMRLNNDNSTFNTGSANATFNLGTGSGTMLHRNGGTYVYLGALFGGPNTKLSGRGNGAAGIVTYEIGGKGIDCNFDGAIVDGGGATAIVKVGANKLTLNGTSTATGVTTVNNGTLEVNGSLNSGPTMNAGLLTGNGSLGGAVSLAATATLKPGGNAIGRFTMSGSLALAAGSTNFMQLDKANGTNDTVVNLGSLTCGGTLAISNLGGTLANGDVFHLFRFAGATNISGVFDEIILPTPPPGIAWNTNAIYTSGQLILGTVASPSPAFNSFTLNGSELVFAGTNGTASGNYYVLTSTNVATPVASWTSIATNVFALDGSFSYTNAVDTNAPQNYFRLQLP
ncbi:MAG: hypothetical protein RL380_1694 [Verrucomicrobiota bacterium]